MAAGDSDQCTSAANITFIKTGCTVGRYSIVSQLEWRKCELIDTARCVYKYELYLAEQQQHSEFGHNIALTYSGSTRGIARFGFSFVRWTPYRMQRPPVSGCSPFLGMF
jgi:hypothetical protein